MVFAIERVSIIANHIERIHTTMTDHIRYDLLTQQALRGVVRNVLTETAKKGLAGDHHFYITFDTQAEGVRLSERMRAQYPEQMTIVLQHQYWDLSVTERGFEVGLSFGGIPEKLFVLFDAIRGFFDPSVQFGLQFEEVIEDADDETEAKPKEKSTRKPNAAGSRPNSTSPKTARSGAALSTSNDEPKGETAKKTVQQDDPKPPQKPSGAEVVRLDRFRKK